MLKDYRYSYSSECVAGTLETIENILSKQPCFPTYSRCRSYMKRVQSVGKVFLWNGIYYELSEQCKNKILSLLKEREFKK